MKGIRSQYLKAGHVWDTRETVVTCTSNQFIVMSTLLMTAKLSRSPAEPEYVYSGRDTLKVKAAPDHLVLFGYLCGEHYEDENEVSTTPLCDAYIGRRVMKALFPRIETLRWFRRQC